MLNKDYKETLQCLSEENVKFLLVGAYAVAAYGYPRATKDIDILVQPARENASSLMKALARFGAPLSGVSETERATGRTQDLADVERLESARLGNR